MAQACVRKQDRFVEEKLKKSLLKKIKKTLLINSSFDMEVLAQKHVEKNSKRDGKTGSKTSPKPCVKLAKTAPFYRV